MALGSDREAHRLSAATRWTGRMRSLELALAARISAVPVFSTLNGPLSKWLSTVRTKRLRRGGHSLRLQRVSLDGKQLLPVEEDAD